jgi:putative restriction endonuclease
MLLAVMDLFESGEALENSFRYEQLLEPFGRYFRIVEQEGDHCTPRLPFFYLKSEGFWHHRPRPGKGPVCEALSKAPTVGKLLEVLECACLDDGLHDRLCVEQHRDALRSALVSRYFSRCRDELWEQIRQAKLTGRYELYLESQVRGAAESEPEVEEYVREAAFCRIVRDAYDFRCSACGLRVILQDGLSIVDAAHLVPFRVSGDNDPRNGIALCKNHHWAMDRKLIAPGPDGKWHVCSELDDRIEGQKSLCDLANREIILPRDEAYHPSEKGLRWRQEKLV